MDFFSHEAWIAMFSIICGVILLYIVAGLEIQLRENGLSGISPKKKSDEEQSYRYYVRNTCTDLILCNAMFQEL